MKVREVAVWVVLLAVLSAVGGVGSQTFNRVVTLESRLDSLVYSHKVTIATLGLLIDRLAPEDWADLFETAIRDFIWLDSLPEAGRKEVSTNAGE